MNSNKIKTHLEETPFFLMNMIISIIFQGIALKWFLMQSHLAVGGLSGISVGIKYLFETFLNIHVSYAILSFAFNIPLLIWAYRDINKKFVIWSALNILCAGLIVDFIPVIKLSDDILANTLIGSFLFGFGTVTALKAGLSTGGSDIVGVIMSKKGKGSVGLYATLLTIIAFLLTFATTTPTIMIYSVLSTLILTLFIDKFYAQSSKVTMLIVTDKAEKVNCYLQRKMHRGSTIWDAKGGYQKTNKNVLLMTISSDQRPILKSIVRKVDPNSFIVSLKTEDTVGEWSSRLGERTYFKKELNLTDDDLYENMGE